jgi:hypothetical protein
LRNRLRDTLLLMIEHRHVEPVEFQRCVALLSRKIGDLAVRAGVPEEECLDLERILTALPSLSRSRAYVILGGIDVQASKGSPAMAMAARYVRALADDVWDSAQHPAATANRRDCSCSP